MLVFRFGGQRFKKSLKTASAATAESTAARVRRRLELIEQGDLSVPDEIDIVTFLTSDGTKAKPPVPKVERRLLTMGQAQEQFLAGIPDGSIEANTRYTLNIHLNHLVRLLGTNLILEQLSFADLQGYIDSRSKEPGRREQPISTTTIRKELASLSSLWSWALQMGHVRSPFPKKGLRFRKVTEKHPFRTLSEIEALVAQGKRTDVELADLWGSVFLTSAELDQLLEHLESNNGDSYLFPMVLTAAHTGARRSELLRSRVSDFDFANSTILIRERKRSKDKETFRRIPLSDRLRRELQAWVGDLPCPDTFHDDGSPLSPDEVTRQLRKALKGTQWERLPGWHVFRHSFISNCASQGIDQRMIDAWSGHQTDEMRRRYTHLIPSVQRAALSSVFEG